MRVNCQQVFDHCMHSCCHSIRISPPCAMQSLGWGIVPMNSSRAVPISWTNRCRYWALAELERSGDTMQEGAHWPPTRQHAGSMPSLKSSWRVMFEKLLHSDSLIKILRKKP